MDFIQLGYLGMFLAAFLAATILPFGSEPVLIALLYAGLHPIGLLTSATIGNTLGGLTSYGIGYLGKWHWAERWLGLKQQSLTRAQSIVEKYGVYTALLCWLPIVGDPIAIVLGFFRVNVYKVALLMLAGKAARYYFLIYLME